MKIEANNHVRVQTYNEAVDQDMKVMRESTRTDAAGATFQKNHEENFVEQFEKKHNVGMGDASARSRTDILKDLVTEKDLAALREYGDETEDEELEVIVTVVEKIKTQLATYCDDYDSGMLDDMSVEQLEKLSDVMGNVMHVAKKLAENNLPVTEENLTDSLSALELVRNTGVPGEDAVKTCLAGEMELSIGNLYLAQHSGAYAGTAGYYAQQGGYYVRNALGVTEDLLPQIEKLLIQSGMTPDETTMAQAEWLVDSQIPLTKDNLVKYNLLEQYINEVRDASPEELEEMTLDRIVEALSQGKRPFDAMAVADSGIGERSRHVMEVLADATDEQVYELTSKGQEVTIAALAQLRGHHHGAVVSEAQMETDIAFITARRRLEEVRMQMTLQASVIMMKNGIDVETAGMQQLIDELKSMEDSYYGELLTANNIPADAQHIGEFRAVTETMTRIAASPAELIGVVSFSRTRLTVGQIQEQGVLLEEKYRQVNDAYEQVMTRPRSDMGDSIQKAFRNVDGILAEMGLEATWYNQRAVRILGYNSVEITYDNIMRMKEADMQVNTMLEGLKPSVVMQMIKEGYNPLDKTVGQVNEQIAQMNQDSSAENEKYSEFLWNLEHSDGITREERDAYVGIYRLLHQIERSDGAVVGAMVEQGASLTMRNLLTGVRSGKHASMDYRVGEMDGVEGTKTGSITKQIEEGFAYIGQLAAQAKEQMAQTDMDKLPQLEELLEMSMETFTRTVHETENAPAGYNSYQNEQLQMLHQACESEENVLAYLSSHNQPVTIGTIMAAGQLSGARGSLFRELREIASEEGEETEHRLYEAMEQAKDSFTDEESAERAYSSMLDVSADVVQERMQDGQVTYGQMKNWKLLSHQLRLCGSLKEEKEYHIPLRIGNELTSVHVTFDTASANKGSVALTWETAVYGRVAARFAEKAGALEGYVVAQNADTKQLFEKNDDILRSMMESATRMETGAVDYVHHEQVDLLKFAEETAAEGEKGNVTSAQLYRAAKAFMEFIAAQ